MRSGFTGRAPDDVENRANSEIRRAGEDGPAAPIDYAAGSSEPDRGRVVHDPDARTPETVLGL